MLVGLAVSAHLYVVHRVSEAVNRLLELDHVTHDLLLGPAQYMLGPSDGRSLSNALHAAEYAKYESLLAATARNILEDLLPSLVDDARVHRRCAQLLQIRRLLIVYCCVHGDIDQFGVLFVLEVVVLPCGHEGRFIHPLLYLLVIGIVLVLFIIRVSLLRRIHQPRSHMRRDDPRLGRIVSCMHTRLELLPPLRACLRAHLGQFLDPASGKALLERL